MTKTDQPLVSIAMCTYNGALFLTEQLDSIVNQTYKNIEIIVVDDQSKDDTVEILESYASRYPNIQIHKNNVNLGYIKNFEKAIGLCIGEFIALCDQDDIWDLNKIQIQLNAIGDNILIYHDSEFINDKGESLHKRMSDVRNFYKGDDSRYFIFENCISGHSVLFNKKLTDYLGTFPTVAYHDWWIAYVATNIGKISFVKQPLVKYRQHSTTSTDILRTKQAQFEDRNISSEKLIARTEFFKNYRFNKHQDFKTKLLKLLKAKRSGQKNWPLFKFVFNYRDVLLFMKKKSFLSKLNSIRKFL